MSQKSLVLWDWYGWSFSSQTNVKVDVSKWGTISLLETLVWAEHGGFFSGNIAIFVNLVIFVELLNTCKCFNEDVSSAIEEVWPSCNFFWRILVSSHSEPKCCRTLNLSVTTFWIKVSHSSLPCARHLLWHLVCDILATSRVRHSGFRVSRLATINCVTLFIFVLVCFV